MKIIYKLVQLQRLDKIILIKAIFLTWLVRIILWIFPFSVLRKLISNISKKKRKLNSISLEKLVWALNVASKYSPKSTCLTRSIAGYILFLTHGYQTEIKIGVCKNDKGNIEAHAWLENNENVVIGESKNNYATILSLGGK